MKRDNIQKLLNWAGPSLGQTCPPVLTEIDFSGAALWAGRNGFFAFDQALHVFPVGDGSRGYDIHAWNSNMLWKFEYDNEEISRCFCFAEDIFGTQFAVLGSTVVSLNPE